MTAIWNKLGSWASFPSGPCRNGQEFHPSVPRRGGQGREPGLHSPGLPFQEAGELEARVSDPFWVTFHFRTASKHRLLTHCSASAHLGQCAALAVPGVPQPLLGWAQVQDSTGTLSASIKPGG